MLFYKNSIKNSNNRYISVKLRKISAIFLTGLVLFSGGCGRTSEPVLEPYGAGADSSSAQAQEETRMPDQKSDQEASAPAGVHQQQEVHTGVHQQQQAEPSAVSAQQQDGAAGADQKADAPAEPGQPQDAFRQQPKKPGESAGQEAVFEDSSVSTVTVHVCGAVKKEGVYTLPSGSRIRDAVEAAGGFDNSADRSWLNLALRLEDAWQIRIPTREETKILRAKGNEAAGDPAFLNGTEDPAGTDPFISGPSIPAMTVSQPGAASDSAGADPAGGESDPDRKININTASLEELTRIPGIGETKARRIIEYREQNGRFEAVEDIMNVTGIKENSFRKMQDYITV